jgi:hypothetical protein
MALVDDHMMPSDSTKRVGFLDDVFVGREKDLEIHALDLICESLSTVLVSLENKNLHAWSP